VSSKSKVSPAGTKREFYLVPSEAHPNQGTATPTKFAVVKDQIFSKGEEQMFEEQMFEEQMLANFTHRLCFMYGNWPGSVRVPSVLQYACKLCKLMKEFVRRDEVHDNLKSSECKVMHEGNMMFL